MNPHPKTTTDADAELVQYLQEVRVVNATRGFWCGKYAGIEDFLLQHGTCFRPVSSLPINVRAMNLTSSFEAAYRVAQRFPAYHYVEGMVLTPLPFHHAWVTNEAGDAIDPSLAVHGFGRAYIGVELDMSVAKTARRVGVLSVMTDYRHGFPLLKGSTCVFNSQAWFPRWELT